MTRAGRFAAMMGISALILAAVGYGALHVRRAILRPHTIESRIAALGPSAREELQANAKESEVHYPPRELTLLAMKRERRIDVYGDGKYLRSFAVIKISGQLGPKLRRGDKQVPEGIYRVSALNPNSKFHVSAKLDYPNEFDRARAAEDGRVDLGSDIFIHGRNTSIGCYALGDPMMSLLFVLIHDVGVENTKVISAPYDLRTGPPVRPPDLPAWVDTLYENLDREMRKYPVPEKLVIVDDPPAFYPEG